MIASVLVLLWLALLGVWVVVGRGLGGPSELGDAPRHAASLVDDPAQG